VRLAINYEGAVASKAALIRRALFVCGVISASLSAALLAGSFLRHVDTQDYLKQADEGVRWVQWGLGSSLLGCVLCVFGKRWWRVVGVVVAFLLLVFWFLIGESLY
jgi:hypothetical protein